MLWIVLVAKIKSDSKQVKVHTTSIYILQSQGKSIVAIAIIHAIYATVDLLKYSANHILITMWDMARHGHLYCK